MSFQLISKTNSDRNAEMNAVLAKITVGPLLAREIAVL